MPAINFSVSMRFQPTLPEGSDQHSLNVYECLQRFQPTLPEGSDTTPFCLYIIKGNFNPHSPKGVTNGKRGAANC